MLSQLANPPPQERGPALLAALAFAAGILLASRLWRPPMWWAVAGLVLAAAATILGLVTARAKAREDLFEEPITSSP